jgi:PAS domain S-box-containing protein
MMCLVDTDRNVQFANNAFLELTGTNEEMLNDGKVGGVVGCLNSFEDPKGCGFGKHCWDCNLRKAMSDTFETGISHINVEYHSTVKLDGQEHEISLLGSTALINTVGTKSLLLCLHDITDRKQAEDALQKSEMLLRTFIDNSPFEIWARDNDGIGILENKKLVDRFGSIIGSKLHADERFAQHEVDLFAEINKLAFAGDIIDEEYEFDANGLQKYYQQIVFPIRNAEKIIGIAGFNIDITDKKMAERALTESREQLAQFAAHLQNIREEERSSLAREIHDDLGQILIAMKIDIGMLKQSVIKFILPEQVEKLRIKFEELQQLVDNTLKSARRIMTNLRPEVLDLLGFVETVNQHLKAYEERYGTKCVFVNNALGVELDSTQSVALYRIVQEAFNNIAKHAKATEVNVSLNLVDDALILQITDNGVGFDTTDKKKTDSYGLLGVKERVVLLNGELTIHSMKNEGTTVQVRFPVLTD